MNKARATVLTIVLGVFFAASAHGFDKGDMDALQTIFLAHRHVGGITPSEDLRSYAEKRGLTDQEMSAMLLLFVRNGMDENADVSQRRMGRGALCGLAQFGGAAEREFVLGIIRTEPDHDFRSMAIRTCIRMMPGEWESVVREVATNERFSNYDRFIAYEETFREGKNANDETKKRIENVLKELAENDPSPANRNHLLKWASDLKGR